MNLIEKLLCPIGIKPGFKLRQRESPYLYLDSCLYLGEHKGLECWSSLSNDGKLRIDVDWVIRLRGAKYYTTMSIYKEKVVVNIRSFGAEDVSFSYSEVFPTKEEWDILEMTTGMHPIVLSLRRNHIKIMRKFHQGVALGNIRVVD